MRAVNRSVVLVVVVGLCLLGVSVAASAKNPPGSSKWCRHHPKSTLAACHSSGGGSPSAITITVSPDPIVETGDSDVAVVISLSTDPVYAEQTVEIISGLGNRCGQGVTWITNQGTSSGATASATIDDDGNAVVTFLGGSCAPGSVQVTADVQAGDGPSATTTFTIDPPQPIN
jgi:hypothetical protein